MNGVHRKKAVGKKQEQLCKNTWLGGQHLFDLKSSAKGDQVGGLFWSKQE